MTSEAFEREYARLNASQKKAVDSVEGPVLVVAGPGSGKTQVISLRVANILLRTDARPGNILCLTFTDSAAANMRRRLASMIGQDAYRVFITTFHSFGTDIIGRFPEHFYGGARFSPADELAQTEVVEGIIRELPYGDPLRSEHPEQGFTYLGDVRQSVSQLKKAGITPDEFRNVLAHNRRALERACDVVAGALDARLSAKSFGEVSRAIAEVRKIDVGPFPLPHFKPYHESLAASLEKALNDAEESGKTEPLSKWKAANLSKDDDGKRILKDLASFAKLESLAGLYEEYRKRMFEAGYYDYDDMLLDVIVTLERNASLRSELQEQFQYVMVDEFQDTNDAQMRLLHLLLDAEVNEGRPNVCAVGDDDQAIYKFQGAELNNILRFRTQYRDPEIITMTDNYRSTQVILDIARFVIERGEERLERIIPGLRKDLKAANPAVAEGGITAKTFPTAGHEYQHVAREARRLLDSGERGESIAVIARKHSELEAIIPFMNAAGVPIAYERQSNVLREPHIREIVTIARFASSILQKDGEAADYLLPEILSYPFWKLDRRDVWRVSIDASKGRRTWLETMLESSNDRVRAVADFLIGVAELSRHEIAEKVLDTIIGSHLTLAPEAETDDVVEDAPSIDSFVSPFKEHYFSARKLRESKSEYLVFLSGLRTFIHSVREYKKGRPVGLDDLVRFVEVHEKNNMAIPDTSPFVNALDAVTLLSAHKAKGLEWKTVFVLNCEDSVWTGRGLGRKISFPMNLPISPAGDTIDDQLRLFYVAITRAKSNLHLTASETKQDGKEALRLQFLLPHGESADREVAKLLEFEPGTVEPESVLSVAASTFYDRPAVYDEEALLRALVDDYQMSVTHLNNYLDVSSGGPMLFLEQNLIRFPQEKSLSSKFGTAMHGTLERIYNHLRSEGRLATPDEAARWLEYELRRERLSKDDWRLLQKRGEKSLSAFLKEKRDSFRPTDRIEVNFANQGACVGDARITGKIDKMVHAGGEEWSVHDFKTGSPQTDWRGSTPYEKVKLHHYRYQLVFYKLLVENSREFCGKCFVKRGCLEFLEPQGGRMIELSLDMEQGDVARVSKLAEIVYKKIKNLEFPDVTGYSNDLAGILAFEDDLLDGRI